MYHHVGIVHRHPLGVLQSGNCRRLLLELLAGKLADRLCDRLYLGGGVPLTYNKIVADSPFDTFQVNGDNLRSFLFLYSFYDGVNQLC